MDNINEDLKYTREIVTKHFNDAKDYWGLGIGCKIIGALIGITSILLGLSSTFTAGAVLIFAIVSEIVQLLSDNLKGRAEGMKRKLEYADGLGWNIPKEELSDYFVRISPKTREAIIKQVKENYFASEEVHSPIRLLQNLQESAWWSKNLTNKMIWGYGIFSLIILIATFIIFMISISAVESLNQLQVVYRIIISVVSVTLSVGIAKLLIGYVKFSKRSEKTEKATISHLKSNVNELDAVLLLHEYQIARASAPFIPTFIWRINRDYLNKLWLEYRK